MSNNWTKIEQKMNKNNEQKIEKKWTSNERKMNKNEQQMMKKNKE